MENKLEKIGQNNFMDNFVKTDDILNDMCGIIESSQKAAYQAVNIALVQRNWLLGYRIAEEELGGQERSEYGLQIIKKLSKELTNRYGKGYDKGTLYRCLKFYKTFPEIVASVRQQSGAILSWTHYRVLIQVEDKAARDWYEKEATEQTWSVRTLQRNISSQYYYRMLGTQKKELVYSFQFAEIFDGTRKRICFCGKATAHSYRKAGLLYRPCVLQLHTEMFCPHRPENREDNTSRCRTDGYVYPYV